MQNSANKSWLPRVLVAMVMLIVSGASYASSSIATRVATFCAPAMTVPNVGACSSCHSDPTNRGVGDLTLAGGWAAAGNDSLFCPAATPSPTPTPPPAPTPPVTPTPPTTGMGMSGGGTTPPPSVGMGTGGSLPMPSSDDDDDDDDDASAMSTVTQQVKSLFGFK